MSTSAGFRDLAPKAANASVAGAGPGDGANQSAWAGEMAHHNGCHGVQTRSWRAAARPAQPMVTGAAPGHDCDAVIVGGGPAGAAAAARLAAQGFTTILVDRATFPRDKVCGDFVGPAAQADICLCSDSFPGYSWLFPADGGQANVGVGMLVSTYPQGGRNLRELLLRLIAADPAMRHRLREARIGGKILGCPLTTYNPRLPLAGDRVMLVGDAAGLINPLNGEGIQYALHSARWAADVASDCLSSDRLDTASLHRYQQRVQHSLGQDMAFSRLAVQLIRNRHLNPVWLRALRVIAARAKTDPDYAYRVGCVVTGLAPATRPLGLSMAAKTAEQPKISARAPASRHRRGRRTPSGSPAPARYRSKIGGTTGPAAASREFAGWTAGVGRALIELIFQLTRAKRTRSRHQGHWTGSASVGRRNHGRHGLPSRGGSCQRSPAGDRRAARKDRA